MQTDANEHKQTSTSPLKQEKVVFKGNDDPLHICICLIIKTVPQGGAHTPSNNILNRSTVLLC